MFELCIKLRETDKYITHKRFMEVKSSLLDIDYGFNFLDSDQNLEESEWKFSNSWSKIREFKNY